MMTKSIIMEFIIPLLTFVASGLLFIAFVVGFLLMTIACMYFIYADKRPKVNDGSTLDAIIIFIAGVVISFGSMSLFVRLIN